MITKFLSKLKTILFKSETPTVISEVKKPTKKTRKNLENLEKPMNIVGWAPCMALSRLFSYPDSDRLRKKNKKL